MSNPVKYYLRNALYAITLMCFNGAIIQTFLSAYGVSPAEYRHVYRRLFCLPGGCHALLLRHG